jgi:hypothetical protein
MRSLIDSEFVISKNLWTLSLLKNGGNVFLVFDGEAGDGSRILQRAWFEQRSEDPVRGRVMFDEHCNPLDLSQLTEGCEYRTWPVSPVNRRILEEKIKGDLGKDMFYLADVAPEKPKGFRGLFGASSSASSALDSLDSMLPMGVVGYTQLSWTEEVITTVNTIKETYNGKMTGSVELNLRAIEELSKLAIPEKITVRDSAAQTESADQGQIAARDSVAQSDEKCSYFLRAMELELSNFLQISYQIKDGDGAILTWLRAFSRMNLMSRIAGGILSHIPATAGGAATFDKVSVGAVICYSMNQAEACKLAKGRATKTIRFLQDGKRDRSNISASIASALCDEFVLAIKMLEKSDKGIIILLDYFAEKIATLIQQAPPELTTSEEKIEYLLANLTLGKIVPTRLNIELSLFSSEEKDALRDLNWNLQGLLQHAPIVVCTLPQEGDELQRYQFAIRRNTCRSKRRGLSVISSDSTYKYPPRVIFSPKIASLILEYNQCSECAAVSCMIPIPAEAIAGEQRGFVKNYIALFSYMRDLTRAPKFSSTREKAMKLKTTLTCFCDLGQNLLEASALTEKAWRHLFTEIQMLRNIYTNVLKTYCDRYAGQDECKKLIETAQTCYRDLSIVYDDRALTETSSLVANM